MARSGNGSYLSLLLSVASFADGFTCGISFGLADVRVIMEPFFRPNSAAVFCASVPVVDISVDFPGGPSWHLISSKLTPAALSIEDSVVDCSSFRGTLSTDPSMFLMRIIVGLLLAVATATKSKKTMDLMIDPMVLARSTKLRLKRQVTPS